MTTADEPEMALPSETLRRLRGILEEHGVGLALLFGSAARPGGGDPADIDLAVEFADLEPTDDGYASAYLDLYTALEDRLDAEVDLVDVRSMSPRFASVVFDEGVLILGSPEHREKLADKLGGETPSAAEARDRVAAAVARLKEEPS